MWATFLLMLSGALIGAGITVIWRDRAWRGRRTFVLERDFAPHSPVPEAEAEILPAHAGAAQLAEPITPVSHAAQDAPFFASAATQPAATLPLSNDAIERIWMDVRGVLSAGVARVNAASAPLSLSVGATGEPAWSYKNRGYGAYRRVLLAEQSIAWLRLELTPDLQLHAVVKAHKDEHADVNASATMSADHLNDIAVGELLSQCLEPAAAFAERQEGQVATPATPAEEEQASARAWASSSAIVASALRATNGALGQVGARLVALGSAEWDPGLCRHRLILAIEVTGEEVGRMRIDRLAHEVEVAVGARDASLMDLGRRRRIPVGGMTIHSLAELIAACAWPTIASFRQTSRSA